MNDNLALEKKILEQKRKDILNEVEQKKRYQEEPVGCQQYTEEYCFPYSG